MSVRHEHNKSPDADRHKRKRIHQHCLVKRDPAKGKWFHRKVAVEESAPLSCSRANLQIQNRRRSQQRQEHLAGNEGEHQCNCNPQKHPENDCCPAGAGLLANRGKNAHCRNAKHSDDCPPPAQHCEKSGRGRYERCNSDHTQQHITKADGREHDP